MMEPLALDAWIARQAQRSAVAMGQAISATHLVRRREAVGQSVVPAKGSVLASPAIADWNPEPDYFFHWLRDSALVMRAVAALMQDAASEPERARWRTHFEDFVNFSLTLSNINGAEFLAHNSGRQTTRRGFRRYLRPDAEIRALAGDRLLGEPRFNPDGTLDIFRWSRPQYDGHYQGVAALHQLRQGYSQSTAVFVALISHDDGHQFEVTQHPLQPRQLHLERMLSAFRRGNMSLAGKSDGRAHLGQLSCKQFVYPNCPERRRVGVAVID